MKSQFRVLRLARLMPIVAAAGAGSAVANSGSPDSAPVITVRPAVIVSMPTEDGKVYQLQASPDLQSWANLGEPVFGTGLPMAQSSNGTGQQFFRLRILTEPEIGDAPWNLEGQTFQFNDGSRVVRCQFPANGPGSWKSGISNKSFTWKWTRNGMNSGQAELFFQGGSREILNLQFNGKSAGRFSRFDYSATRLLGTHAGSFGPAPALPSATPLAPLDILGRTLALGDAPTGSSLTLTSASGGTRCLDGESTEFSGQWLVTGSATARLTANFGSTHGEEYDFTFTAPGTGRFTRTTFTGGMFPDVDHGTFCLGNPP